MAAKIKIQVLSFDISFYFLSIILPYLKVISVLLLHIAFLFHIAHYKFQF